MDSCAYGHSYKHTRIKRRSQLSARMHIWAQAVDMHASGHTTAHPSIHKNSKSL
jgi:hypothetical protein